MTPTSDLGDFRSWIHCNPGILDPTSGIQDLSVWILDSMSGISDSNVWILDPMSGISDPNV